MLSGLRQQLIIASSSCVSWMKSLGRLHLGCCNHRAPEAGAMWRLTWAECPRWLLNHVWHVCAPPSGLSFWQSNLDLWYDSSGFQEAGSRNFQSSQRPGLKLTQCHFHCILLVEAVRGQPRFQMVQDWNPSLDGGCGMHIEGGKELKTVIWELNQSSWS